MQKIIIFGTGELAQRIFYYLKNSDDKVVAFSANKSNIDSNELLGLPVVEFENIEQKYPRGLPDAFQVGKNFVGKKHENRNKFYTKQIFLH